MKIEPGKYLFSKIEYLDYDIIVPFSCRRTGSCCHVYVPSAPSLSELAIDFIALNEPELMAEGMAMHRAWE